MKPLTVRYIGDKNSPAERVESYLKAVNVASESGADVTVDYDYYCNADPDEVVRQVIGRLEVAGRVPTWRDFFGLVLDLNFSDRHQPLGGFDVFDGIVAYCRLQDVPLPWKRVYISTIIVALPQYYNELHDGILQRNIEDENLFASPDTPGLQGLATKVKEDYSRSLDL
jgi:hypothetical protein